jgi:hypothetical protein
MGRREDGRKEQGAGGKRGGRDEGKRAGGGSRGERRGCVREEKNREALQRGPTS